MAFTASDHKVRDWISLDSSNSLTKVVRTFNSENLVASEYKTRSVLGVGDPSLFIEYIYDTSGNILAENKEVLEWTSVQEAIYTGASAVVTAAGGDNVTAATQTTYATVNTDVQYWLGLEADGQLTKQHIGTATSVKRIEHYALPGAAVGDTCLQRVFAIDSSVVTGCQDILGTWSLAMQNIVAPPISDFTLSAASTVEDQVIGADIGNLATTGSVTGHGDITWTIEDNDGLENIRIVSGVLEVGPDKIAGDASGDSPYSVVIRATDELGAYREETHAITVTSNDITDIPITATTIPYGSNADTAIGTLSATNGVGDVSFAITSNGGMTNLRLDAGGVILEAGPSWMNTAAGSYTVRITATDSREPTPQTFFKDITITVSSTAITDIALTAASINYGDAANTAIGTLSFTGGFSTVTPTISSAGGMTNLRLDGNVLEAGPSFMNTAAGTYSVTILATDTRGQTFSKAFTITVVSTAITDIALSAAAVPDNAVEDVLIGNITDTGGHGTVTYAITDAGGLDNIRIDAAKLEVGSGGIIDSAGSYTVRITATDDVGQTFFKDFTITVSVSWASTHGFTWSQALGAGDVDAGVKCVNDDAIANAYTNCTHTFWVKHMDTNNPDRTGTGYGKYNIMGNGPHWSRRVMFGWNNTEIIQDNRLCFQAQSLSGVYVINVYDHPTGATHDTNWHFVCLVLKGTISSSTAEADLEFWWDGELQDPTTADSSYAGTWADDSALSYFIQMGPTFSLSGFGAHVDEYAVWDTALSSEEITEAYSSAAAMDYNTHSQASNLVSWWRFGEGDDDADSSGADTVDNRIYDMSDASSGANYGIPGNEVGTTSGDKTYIGTDDFVGE